jgi:uncharacterized protein (TIGR02611 family)
LVDVEGMSSPGGRETDTSGVTDKHGVNEVTDRTGSAVSGSATGSAVVSGSAAGSPAAAGGRHGRARPWRRVRARARLARQRVRAVPGGQTFLKVLIATLGAAVVALGLALVPLPGPGWAIVFFGLAIWAIEFAWAARLLDWVRAKVWAFARMMGRLHWSARVAIGLTTLAALTSIGWLWIKHRYGFETLGQLWEFLSQ